MLEVTVKGNLNYLPLLLLRRFSYMSSGSGQIKDDIRYNLIAHAAAGKDATEIEWPQNRFVKCRKAAGHESYEEALVRVT